MLLFPFLLSFAEKRAMESPWNQGEINYIESHCNIKDTLQEAALEVLNKAKPEDDEVETEVLYNERLKRFITDVAKKYNFCFYKLLAKVQIVREMNNYREAKEKYEKAIDAYKSYRHITGNDVSEIAERYSVKKHILTKEIRKFNNLKNEGLHYEYDRKVLNNKHGFTYIEEKMLLNQLRDWAIIQRNYTNLPSINVFYALIQVSILAYQLGQELANKGKNIEFLKSWTNGRDLMWLIDFEMRYTDELKSLL